MGYGGKHKDACKGIILWIAVGVSLSKGTFAFFPNSTAHSQRFAITVFNVSVQSFMFRAAASQCDYSVCSFPWPPWAPINFIAVYLDRRNLSCLAV